MRRLFSRFLSAQGSTTGHYPEPRLKDLIFFVTDRCNMRCNHCMFRHRVDHPGPELTLEQVSTLARSIPRLRTVALTGGEPFLREDLWEIIKTFCLENRTFHVQVDTNGSMPDRMLEILDRFADLQSGAFMTFQVSLDGLKDTHERLRHSPGSFDRAVTALQACRERQDSTPHFRVVALTDIHRENVTEIEPLADLLSGLRIPHVYDFVRGVDYSSWGIPADIRADENPRDCGLPPLEDLPNLVERIAAVELREGGQFCQWMEQLQIQVDLYRGGKPPFPCLSAGRTAGVVYSDGSVAACEFTRPFGNLTDCRFDLNALWNGPEAEQRRKKIVSCRCTHSCFLLTSHQEWLEQTGQIPAFESAESDG